MGSAISLSRGLFMSLRFASLLALAGVTAMLAGCVVEQPAPRPHRVVYVEQQPAPPPPPVVEVIAPQPPPVEVIEEVPPPRPGYVWARGYWHWNGARYVAVHGHWEAVRPGYHYVHPHWEHHPDGWHLHVGVWVQG
jgi:hypothetical protein